VKVRNCWSRTFWSSCCPFSGIIVLKVPQKILATAYRIRCIEDMHSFLVKLNTVLSYCFDLVMRFEE